MEKARKITVVVPAALLEQAQKASGRGITQTVRAGLELVAASHSFTADARSVSRAYQRLRKLRGSEKDATDIPRRR